MAVIEKHLHDHFASLDEEEEDTSVASNQRTSDLRDFIPESLDEPFARVNSVVADSPAEAAGLKAGDIIRNFGYVNKSNHDNLKKVAECVQGNEGVRCSGLSTSGLQLTNKSYSKIFSLRFRGPTEDIHHKNFA
jgi:26S proteasome non-ATPase regulatory subunit 9